MKGREYIETMIELKEILSDDNWYMADKYDIDIDILTFSKLRNQLVDSENFHYFFIDIGDELDNIKETNNSTNIINWNITIDIPGVITDLDSLGCLIFADYYDVNNIDKLLVIEFY